MPSKQHWRRDEPTFYNFLALEHRTLDGPELVLGLHGALMSKDMRSDAHTWLVELPVGWHARTDAKYGSFELFVLRGSVSLDGNSVGCGGYVHLPQLCGGGELASETGALVIAFWNPNIPAFPYPVTRNRAVDTFRLPWMNSVPGAHGVMHKSLRLPD
ncbi:MAG: hypothetical protein NZM12_03330, partial [Steroidobacteraceae bacterium]|nr:hypothetical protein [Steroidobacteraceae bacterium]